MRLRPFGATGLEVSPIAYGAMGLAGDPEIADGVAPSLLRALEGGVNLIDTARGYPHSEALIASTLKAWRGPAPLISTKIRPLGRDTWRFPRPIAEAFTPASIRASVEESLRTLGIETLDIVHLHQWWALWTFEPDWLATLVELRREGKLRCIAISAQDHEHDALLPALTHGLVDGVQVIVNLFESRPANSLAPLAADRGIGVIARCVLDSGGLSGLLSHDDFLARAFLRHAPYDGYQARLQALAAAFVPVHAESLAELAVRFVLSLPGVSCAALGLPAAALVDEALAWADKGPLPDAVVEAIRREHVWSKNFYERLL
jgi:aryl-alcohol dehydrogenase-like predicted oxidoreductase